VKLSDIISIFHILPGDQFNVRVWVPWLFEKDIRKIDNKFVGIARLDGVSDEWKLLPTCTIALQEKIRGTSGTITIRNTIEFSVLNHLSRMDEDIAAEIAALSRWNKDEIDMYLEMYLNRRRENGYGNSKNQQS
jgi:hypothetical protein